MLEKKLDPKNKELASKDAKKKNSTKGSSYQDLNKASFKLCLERLNTFYTSNKKKSA